VETSVVDLANSVDDLLRHLDVWVRVFDAEITESDFSQEQSSQVTPDNEIVGNTSFNRILSARQFRSFVLSGLSKSPVQSAATLGSSLVLVTMLPRPVDMPHARPVNDPLDYLKMELEPQGTGGNSPGLVGHFSVRLTAGRSGWPKNDEVTMADLSDRDSRLELATCFFASEEVRSYVDDSVVSSFIQQCQREERDLDKCTMEPEGSPVKDGLLRDARSVLKDVLNGHDKAGLGGGRRESGEETKSDA
jgi:hypothetical protein